MPTISPRTRRLLGYSLISAIWATLFGMLVFVTIVFSIFADLKAPHHRFLTKGTGLERVAQNFYLSRFRPGWQDQGGYVDFDQELVYVPKIGTKPFQGPEFRVNITFDPKGLRLQPNQTSSVGDVVVTGDSFAMGWGVENNETFSAVLSSRYHWQTSNCAVSSYGTARELLRLKRLKLIENATCIIIAYCYNDPDENHAFVEDPSGFISKRNPAELWKTLARYHQSQLTFGLIGTLTYEHLHERRKALGTKAAIRELFTAQTEPTGQLVEASLPAETIASDFLRIIDSFPELAGKLIIVTEINDWGRSTRFLPELKRLAANRPKLVPVPIKFDRSDFFRFDNHLTAAGHKKVAARLNEVLATIAVQSR